MLTTVEGVYKDGKVELTETPTDTQESRALVTFLRNGDRQNGSKAPQAEPIKQGQMIRFGMFLELLALTDEDFKAAEFHGDPDDGLDWS